MRLIIEHNKNRIENYLRKNISLNIYSIGDLDDFFWNYTTWFALEKDAEIKALFLLYYAPNIPTLLAMGSPDNKYSEVLFKKLKNYLPNNFYCHISPHLKKYLESNYKNSFGGEYNKMLLVDKNKLKNTSNSSVKNLKLKDLSKIKNLYKNSYPENWFDERMLETGQYFGFFYNENLVSVSGIHVYSKKYKVSALGNITTDKNFRGKGFSKLTTATLCKSLIDNGIENIGLNVKYDNNSAIRCYEKLGFEITNKYLEFSISGIS